MMEGLIPQADPDMKDGLVSEEHQTSAKMCYPAGNTSLHLFDAIISLY